MFWLCIAVLTIVLISIRVWAFRTSVRRQVGWTRGRKGRKNGYIYFFRGAREAVWQVKIGRTNNLEHRLRSHRTANPYGIILLAAFRTSDDVKAERILHNTFAKTRISRHNEWFYITLDMLIYMWLLRDRQLTERTTAWLR